MSLDFLTAMDDGLHDSVPGDPFSTETIWFGFSSEIRKLGGATYVLMRPNLGVCSLGIWMWDDTASTNDTMLYFQNYWHLPLPDDLRNLKLPCGYSERVVEPAHKYQVQYDDGVELKLDLLFEGIHAPVARQTGRDLYPGSVQLGRVTGCVVLNGESIDVDSHEFRGRAWSTSRPDRRAAPMPADPPDDLPVYTDTFAAASPRDAFFVTTQGGLAKTRIVSGYLSRDGVLAPVVSGERSVRRNPAHGYPEQLIVDGVDDIGRTFRGVGTCVNRHASGNPRAPISVSGVSWVLDDEPAWGQDQDCPQWMPGLEGISD